MELVLITDDRRVSPFMRYPVPHSEIAGPAFDPSGTRLYFASQAKRHREDENGNVVYGEVFEISGPFRGAGAPVSRTGSSAAAGGVMAQASLAGLALAAAAWHAAEANREDED